MSADNMICIQKRADGKWWVWMGFASDDTHCPKPDSDSFDTKEEAHLFARGWARGEMFLEYGVVILEPQVQSDALSDLVDIVDAMRTSGISIRLLYLARDLIDEMCVEKAGELGSNIVAGAAKRVG